MSKLHRLLTKHKNINELSNTINFEQLLAKIKETRRDDISTIEALTLMANGDIGVIYYSRGGTFEALKISKDWCGYDDCVNES